MDRERRVPSSAEESEAPGIVDAEKLKAFRESVSLRDKRQEEFLRLISAGEKSSRPFLDAWARLSRAQDDIDRLIKAEIRGRL